MEIWSLGKQYVTITNPPLYTGPPLPPPPPKKKFPGLLTLPSPSQGKYVIVNRSLSYFCATFTAITCMSSFKLIIIIKPTSSNGNIFAILAISFCF